MAISKEKKELIVKKLKEVVDKAKSLVFVNFHGLKVSDATTMRNVLRGEGIGYIVAKKTLISRVLKGTSIAGELPILDGEIAVAYGDDDILPAKRIYDFQKQTGDALKIAGGVFEAKYLDARAMMEIASIPAREVLYGQFVNIINSPIQGLVIALDAIAQKKS